MIAYLLGTIINFLKNNMILFINHKFTAIFRIDHVQLTITISPLNLFAKTQHQENGECKNLVEFKDLFNMKYIPLNTQNSIDKVFELFSKELKNINKTNDKIIEGENVIFHMTSSKNQHYYYENNLYNNISSIDFGECEKILQEKFQIDEILIIMKVDIKRDDTSSTQIEYQVFNPINLQQSDLSYCDNAKIVVYPPIDLDNKTYNLLKHLKDQDIIYLMSMIPFIMIYAHLSIHLMILMFY